jgi:hypothetical protein
MCAHIPPFAGGELVTGSVVLNETLAALEARHFMIFVPPKVLPNGNTSATSASSSTHRSSVGLDAGAHVLTEPLFGSGEERAASPLYKHASHDKNGINFIENMVKFRASEQVCFSKIPL